MASWLSQRFLERNKEIVVRNLISKIFFFIKYSLVSCLCVILQFIHISHLWAPRGFGDLGRTAIYFQGAGEHW